MRKVILFLILVHSWQIYGQQNYTLEECYRLAKQNYPLARQRGYLNSILTKQLHNLQTNKKPQVELIGQATYQSDVTSIPIKLPNIEIQQIAKDQYKLYAEIKQNIFDGGITEAQKAVQIANTKVDEQKIEVELDKLKERINQLYFSILLAKNQWKITQDIQNELQAKISKVQAGIQNGVSITSTLNTLQVELLKTEQKVIEILAAEKSARESLGLLLNQDMANAQLQSPIYPQASSESVFKRPELTLFSLQKEAIDQQNLQLKAKYLPKVGLFLQTGLGRPALNFLDNSFTGYYLGGLRVNWSLSGFYTHKNEKAILSISQQSIDIQKDIFLLNNNIALKQATSEIEKLTSIIQKDEQMIALREKIKQTSSIQLDNGTITASDFISDLTAENQAKENKLLHEIQLLLAKTNYQTILGQ